MGNQHLISKLPFVDNCLTEFTKAKTRLNS